TTLVTNVQTLDDLDAEGAGLTYSITGGDDQAFFTIDATTGELSFIAPPDFENPLDGGTNPTDNNYEVQVTVTDSGLLTDTQDITVTVNDVADGSPPVVSNVTYNTLANSVLEVAGADLNGGEQTSITSTVSLLDGASDPDMDGLLVSSTGIFTTAEGGSVTIFADGSFFYQPEAGDANLTDSFSFTVSDGLNSTNATAFINVGSEAIYVDDDTAAGTGNGSVFNPFTTLTEAQALAGAGDVIYVFDGTYNESFVFETDQSLIGQGADFTLSTGELLDGDASTSPVINGTLSGTNVGTATVSGVTVNSGSSTALDLVFSAGTADVDVVSSIFNGASVDGILDVDVSNNANVRIDVTDSTFDPGAADSEGISLNASNSTQLNFNLIGNTVTGNSIDDDAIEVELFNSAIAEGRINNNSITANNSIGVRIDLVNGSPTGVFEINNNFIDVNSVVPNTGIGAVFLEIPTGTGDFTIGNNDIDIDPDVTFSGITGEVSLGGGVASASYNIFGNDVNQLGFFGDAYAILQTNPGTSVLDGFNTNVLTTLNNNGNPVGGAPLAGGQVFEQGTHVAGTTETVDIDEP
ncbi:MAG: Ig-like domain-containing protein, partial [Synechococcus sp.]